MTKNLKVVFISFSFLILGCSENSETATVPTAVVLNSPNNNENCNTGISISSSQASVEFSWFEGSGVSSYSLTITNLLTQAQINRSGITETSISIDLNKGSAYEWYVTSNSDKYPNDKPESETWRFYLKGNGELNSAPFPADLLSPKSGEVITLVSGMFEMQWAGSDPDGDDISYSLYIDKSLSFNSNPNGAFPLQLITNLEESTTQVELEANNIYYWKVNTFDSNGNSTYSQVRSFRIE